MAPCTVCGKELPAQLGPRARRYCSRACQAKAYRARQQQHTGHQAAAADVPALLAEYDGTPSRQLADSLALAAGRLAGSLTAGLPADDFDLGVLTRIPVVLTARARQAATSAEAVHGRPDINATPTMAMAELTRPSRDDSDTPKPAPHRTTAQPTGESPAPSPPASSPAPSAPEASRNEPARPMSQKKAREFTAGAHLVKRDRDTHHYEVVTTNGTVVGHVQPSYKAGRRHGWNGWAAGSSYSSYLQAHSTRDQAGADALGQWIRLVTAKPRR